MSCLKNEDIGLYQCLPIVLDRKNDLVFVKYIDFLAWPLETQI